jgi:tetratricopeptide (TPR) repeat protein
MSQRIQLLKKFLEDDPSDPFTLYALALEYVKIDPQKAMDTFHLLLADHGEYLPAYYQLAKLYESRGQQENAAMTYEKGILIAKKQNDLKTLRELASAKEEMEG